MQKREVAVVGALRTAIGTFDGSLKYHSPTELAATIIRGLLDKYQLAANKVEQCVFGNVIHTQASDMYLARIAALEAGLGNESTALTVNRLCGSGLQAIISAAQQIELGICHTVIAGGAESMTRAPYWLPTARFGQRLGDAQMIDTVLAALRCPANQYHMGITAENIAQQYQISRARQDEHALESQQRAGSAISAGLFTRQIMPIEPIGKKHDIFKVDEHVRADVSLESLTAMRAAFKKEGTVTAGNASGLNDGAAAVLLMEREQAESQGRDVLGVLRGYQVVGVSPALMGMGPVPAIQQLLKQCHLTVDDIDLFEINEAFAAQAIAVIDELQIPSEKVNPNGSGISLGHPIGATGAMLVTKALYELQRTQGEYAVVSLCIGGGQGIAALFQRP